MNRTSFKQKLLLFFFSLSLTVILLEILLRIAGSIVLYLQERQNHLSFNQNEYRILCLGESTTALGGEDSYPSQLQKSLNANRIHHRNFTVINKGIISTTSSYILSHLDHNLDLYKPQMVILMMGINDKAYLHGPYKDLWWENIKLFVKDLRVYKLGHLIADHINHRIKEIKIPVAAVELPHNEDGNDQQIEGFLKIVLANSIERFSEHLTAGLHYQKNRQFTEAQQQFEYSRQSAKLASLTCIELAKRDRIQGLFQEAQRILDQANAFEPNSPDFYQERGELSLAEMNSSQAIKDFQTALSLDPQNTDSLYGLAHAYYLEHNENSFLFYAAYLQNKKQDYWGYIEIAKWLKEYKHFEQAREFLNRAIEIQPGIEQGYLEIGQILDDQAMYKEEESFYLKEIALHPHIARIYQALGKYYQRQGKEDLAKKYFQQEAQQEMAEYYPTTLVNYSLIINKILSRHIKVVVMQYPLREIGPLKDYLGQRNGVFFVENKQNFMNALTNKSFSYYFKDNFAYNFGHCTRAGNELIAKNLNEFIQKTILRAGD